jgi:hypothetical protein
MVCISSNNDRQPVTKTFTLLHYSHSTSLHSFHFTTLTPLLYTHSTSLFSLHSLHFTTLTPLHYTHSTSLHLLSVVVRKKNYMSLCCRIIRLSVYCSRLHSIGCRILLLPVTQTPPVNLFSPAVNFDRDLGGGLTVVLLELCVTYCSCTVCVLLSDIL